MFKKKYKLFDLFLAIIIFYTFLFQSLAMSANNSGVGPSDRVRKVSQQRFTYSKQEGFNCDVDGISLYGGADNNVDWINTKDCGEETCETITENSFNPNEGLAVVNFILKNIMFVLSCFASGSVLVDMVMSFGKNIGSKFSDNVKTPSTGAKAVTGLKAVAALIISLLGEMWDDFFTSINGVSDYKIESNNEVPNCMALDIFVKVFCAVIGITLDIVMKLSKISAGKKTGAFFIILGISAVVDAIIIGATKPAYYNASSSISTISLCGDEWLTIGNYELQEKLDEIEGIKKGNKILITNGEITKLAKKGIENVSKNFGIDAIDTNGTLNLIAENDQTGLSQNDISFIKHYPSKGMFNGSYKYLLYSCFKDRRLKSCKVLFPNLSVLNDESINIDFLYNKKYKPYREYIYDGMEYENPNNLCKDTRPERKTYITDNNNSETQLYYFRGTEMANFACERFLINNGKHKEDHKCCNEAMYTKICIQNKDQDVAGHILCDYNADYKDCSLLIINNFLKFNGPDTTDSESNDSDTIKNIEAFKEKVSEAMEALKDKNKNDENIKKNATELGDFIAETDYGEAIEAVNSIKKNNEQQLFVFQFLVQFHIQESIFSENKYCVATYNLCPYNFNIKGGTEYYGREFLETVESGLKIKKVDSGCVEIPENQCAYKEKKKSRIKEFYNKKNNCSIIKNQNNKGDKICKGICFTPDINNKDAGTYEDCYNKPSNFCQIDRHCTFVPPRREIEPPLYSPYVDKACLNFIGSSHFSDDYNNITAYVEPTSLNTKNFTAPFVECFTETFKNMLLNQAGHTRCINASEFTSDDKTCTSGVKFYKGQNLDEIKYPNTFLKLKTALEKTAKALMVLMVSFFGFKILIEKNKIKEEGGQEDQSALSKYDIMSKIFTIVAVSYFSLSSTWVRPLFKYIYGVSNAVYDYAAQISVFNDDNKFYDSPTFSGCYFFKNKFIDNNYSSYKDRTYLALFDTLDCKLATYTGFIKESMSEPPILSLILASLLSFGAVIWMVFPLIILCAGLILMVIKVAYIFIIRSLYLTALLFAAPLMIPLFLFERTKKGFETWLSSIINNIFSSVFIIISTCLFFMVFEKFYMKDNLFFGTKAPIRDMYCGKICKIGENTIKPILPGDTKFEMDCKNEYKGEVRNLQTQSLLCLLNDDRYTKSSSTGTGVLDFLIENGVKLGGLMVAAAYMITMMFDVIFLLLILFLFDMFLTYVDKIQDAIFGAEGKVDTSGLMSMKDLSSKIGGAAGQLSNMGSDAFKATAAWSRNKHRENEDKKILRDGASKDDATKNKSKEDEAEGEEKNESTPTNNASAALTRSSDGQEANDLKNESVTLTRSDDNQDNEG